MKPRKFSLATALFGLSMLLLPSIQPVSAGDAADQLTEMLNDFLAGASINDADAHDRFWAEDLVYTSSSGERFGKAFIMAGLSDSANENNGPSAVYSAEEVQVRHYGNTAVVAFRLVAEESEAQSRTDYFNTGTFLKRDDEWRVVAWQATRIPSDEGN